MCNIGAGHKVSYKYKLVIKFSSCLRCLKDTSNIASSSFLSNPVKDCSSALMTGSTSSSARLRPVSVKNICLFFFAFRSKLESDKSFLFHGFKGRIDSLGTVEPLLTYISLSDPLTIIIYGI